MIKEYYQQKVKLNSMGILICKVLIDSNNSPDEFVITDNGLKEYNDIKEKINDIKTSSVN